MGREWTDEQMMVLAERDNNLLVSAAAGSGKTAVMVERIIRLVTQGENPPDIDRFLVVTFTRAAAASMRERIADALVKALEKDPGNIHIQKQTALIHQAQITTIHSFCQEVVRSHFFDLDIDPGFRVGDEGEMLLLKEQVMDDLMEEAHELADKDTRIQAFFDYFTRKTLDTQAAQQILRIYDYSCAYPWPDQFRASLTEAYQADDISGLENAAWMKELEEETQRLADETVTELEFLIRLCQEENGPAEYLPALESDLSHFTALKEGLAPLAYDERRDLVYRACDWIRIASVRKGTDKELAGMIKDARNDLKEAWKKVKDGCYACDARRILEMNGRIALPLEGLVFLADRFEEKFAQAKADLGVADFSDLEHFALRILCDRSGAATAAGREYARKFRYVMTDEYQDSNLVQETILEAVSGNARGAANRFMVGDVKQSIYRFRQARPDLFIGKYRSWKKVREAGQIPGTAGENHTVELHRNFRSRSEILSVVNAVFEEIMAADIGGVDYDQDAFLHSGAVFPALPDEYQSGTAFCKEPELWLLENAGSGQDDDDDTDDAVIPDLNSTLLWNLWDHASDREKEAFIIAERISAMAGQYPVLDEESGGYRKAGYGDIAVLYRGGDRWPDALEKALSLYGIPSFSGGGGGYFETQEIRTVLALLSVIDNPRQDIPLVCVLRSPVGGFTDGELSDIRAASPDTDFYSALVFCAQQGNGKAERFISMLDEQRSLVASCSVHELIWHVLDVTGYTHYVCALPGGDRRYANLKLLVQKAIDFEQGSDRSLFRFLHYIRNIKKVSDAPEAVLSEAGENTVRIMTIHKSKGLEFPIVFVCGLGRKLGGRESSESILLDPVYGIGMDELNTAHHVRTSSIQRQIIAGNQKKEGMGEELRILYVAMTRAKEKLVLTGTVPDLARAYDKWRRAGLRKEVLLPAQYRLQAGCYLDLIMPVKWKAPTPLVFNEITERDLWDTVKAHMNGPQNTPKEAGTEEIDDEMLTRLREHLAILSARERYVSVLEERTPIPVTVSVSELKHPMYEEEMRQQAMILSDDAGSDSSPGTAGLSEDREGGAARGSAYHTLMENLNYCDPDIEGQLESLVKCGKIDRFGADRICVEDIAAFTRDPVGIRMRNAFEKNDLHRETPFVIGRKARDLKEEWDSDEIVLVQGIIDAWFEENGKIILLDYKTDRVDGHSDPEGETLIRRYRLQLSIYADALRSMTGMDTDEALIYSFALRKCIPVNIN